MTVEEIAPGLWRWTAYHAEWKHDVGCVYAETPDGIVLIDPLVPPDDPAPFWAALDRDVKRLAGPVHVVITVYWHARSSREVVERYSARLWASSKARAAIARRAGEPTDVFRPGDELPGGIRAFSGGRGSEVCYWLPGHRAVVFGDFVLGPADGEIELCPESWLTKGLSHAELRARLRPLLDLPVERVLVSHGEPVRANGHARLAEVLRA